MKSFIHAFAALLIFSCSVRAEEGMEGEAKPTDVASEDIGTTLRRQQSLEKRFDGHLIPDWLKRWQSKRDAKLKRARVKLSMAYDSAVLAGIGGGNPLSAASGELSLTGNWRIAGEDRDVPLDLHFRVRHRHAFGNRSASALGGDLGTLWGVVDGFSDSGFEIPEFYFKRRFLRRDLELRFGQLSVDSQLDSHALRGAKQAFLNRAFASNPAVAFPRFGAGATLHWDHESGFDLTAGATTIQATKTGDQVDFDLGSSDLFEALQAGYDFAGYCGDPARLQIMGWNADAINSENIPGGRGAALTFEQEFTAAQARMFLRYAWSDGEATDLKHLVAGGFGKTCRDFDLFGVALAAGQSSGPTGDWQVVLETFYRMQLAAEFHITPDIQLVFGDGFPGGGDLRVIFGIRGHVSF